MSEKMLEELYEMLTLYFESEFSPGGDFVKTFGKRYDVEPQLDRVIFREKILAGITRLITGGERNV